MALTFPIVTPKWASPVFGAGNLKTAILAFCQIIPCPCSAGLTSVGLMHSKQKCSSSNHCDPEMIWKKFLPRSGRALTMTEILEIESKEWLLDRCVIMMTRPYTKRRAGHTAILW